MVHYLVTWTIYSGEVNNAREAAEKALALQRDVNSTSLCFKVTDELTGKTEVVDLTLEGE